MAEVRYVVATCVYPGNPTPAVDELTLEIRDGEFMVLVGPSGSGKSTALRMLAGLEEVTSGLITINGADVSNQPPKERDIAMVFQNYALYPQMTVEDNMGFALKLRGVSKRERHTKVADVASMLGLDELLSRKPKQLSGGQRQRVAMGRAIVREPSVFLMDEPLSNLDAKLRIETRANIAALQAKLGTTTVYVTHDQIEAMTLGHRVAVLRDGVLQQCAEPRAMYDKPANAFVAGFIGSPAMNLRKVRLTEGGALLGGVHVPLPASVMTTAVRTGLDSVLLGLRPEAFVVVTNQGPRTDGAIAVQVKLVEELGADAFAFGSLLNDDLTSERNVVVRVDSRRAPKIGDTIHIRALYEQAHAFDPNTGLRLE